jgi:serine/threonine protein phosphatase PrpC
MKSQFTWRSAAATIVGNVRTRNEDAVLELPSVGLWAVADGMGGHNAGDVASQMVVMTLANVRNHQRASALLDEVEDRLHAVNDHLIEFAGKEGIAGSTVAVLLALDRHVLSLWAGDSRIYRSRKGQLAQLTRDHSETQEMLDDGRLSPLDLIRRQSSNVITRAVGGAADLFLDIELSPLQDGDRYLLCTDGLHKELSERELARYLAHRRPDEACQALLWCAERGVCDDNVSAVVVRFVEP